MKNFLFKILNRLPFLAGINQIKDLSPNQVAELVQELLDECNRHTSLTDQKKQELIENGIKNEQEFYGLNVRILNKWFYQYKSSNQIAGRQPADSPDYLKTVEENDRKYKKMLEEKRKEDPDYDPKKEAMNQILNITKAKAQSPKRRRRRPGQEIDFEEVK